jgi:hypothetical protein
MRRFSGTWGSRRHAAGRYGTHQGRFVGEHSQAVPLHAKFHILRSADPAATDVRHYLIRFFLIRLRAVGGSSSRIWWLISLSAASQISRHHNRCARCDQMISPANPAVITSMVNHTLQRSCVAHYVYETCEDIWDFKWRMECDVILWPV